MDEYKPCAAMVVAQCINAAMALWSKAAFTGGMSPLIFVVYRQAIATVVLVPIAIVTNRKKMKDTMGLGIVGFSLVFVASLVGATVNQCLYYQGVHLGSSSLATAMTNLIPAMTFVMAASVGLETVDVRRPSSLAKIFGTAVCVSGAMSALLVSFLLPDMDAWRIHSLFEFSCCLFSGVFGSGVMFYLQSWCISVRGPLFSAMFNPLCTVITTVLAAIVLREKLHVGSLLGAIAVIAGLYVVLWGKADDGGKRGTETEHAVDDLEKMTMNRSDSMLDAGEGISEPLLRTDGDLVEK
nr:unnamed protein product [Digitaria exilis]